MRWDDLFAELEAEMRGVIRQDLEAEVTEMMHAEATTIDLADRLRHVAGEEVSVRLRNGESRRGRLAEATHAWLVLHHGTRRFLLPLPAVSHVSPLGGAAPKERGVAGRLTLGSALRKLAGAGLEVRVITDGGELRGRIGMVGADHCDVLTATGTVAVPWPAIVAIEG